jgi:hypothetical protein
VLGQASVLMATSNGMVSSVVRRGAFIMQQLLGVDPGSPPKDVPALDRQPLVKPDGSPFTQRERLAMHRADASCARCHDQIDPLGVGLENYNAIGAFNASLRLLVTPKTGKPTWQEVPADVSGRMLDGTTYDGPDQLKQRLLDHRDQFVRCFVGKLAVYGLGRPLQTSDGAVIERICARLPDQHYGLSTLVEQLILSELFRTK